MFESALFESQGLLKTRTKFWSIPTFLLLSSVIATFTLIPLIYPEALPRTAMTVMLTAPPPPPPAPPPPPPPQPAVAHAAANFKVVTLETTFHAPSVIPHEIRMVHEVAAPSSNTTGVQGMYGMTNGVQGMNNILRAIGPTPSIQVKHVQSGPIRISSGVAAGYLVNKITPVYPAIAKAAHVQGVVVLHAIISKTGSIENLTVVSGPPMLREAAIDGVQLWRYRPYLLNGEPTEVDTTITVNFVAANNAE